MGNIMMVDDLSPEVGVVLKMSWDIQYIVELLGKFGNDQRNGLSVWVNSLLEGGTWELGERKPTTRMHTCQKANDMAMYVVW